MLKVPEATFLLLALPLFDGLAQPSTDRQLAKSRGKGKKGKKNGKASPYNGGKSPFFGRLGALPKTPTSR